MLKKNLITPHVLSLPNDNQLFRIKTDAFDKLVGCVPLRLQRYENDFYAGKYWSGLLNKAEDCNLLFNGAVGKFWGVYFCQGSARKERVVPSVQTSKRCDTYYDLGSRAGECMLAAASRGVQPKEFSAVQSQKCCWCLVSSDFQRNGRHRNGQKRSKEATFRFSVTHCPL